MAKVIKGIVRAKDLEGSPRYKVRYEGLGTEGDEWVGSDRVTEAQVERFKALKAKQDSKKEQLLAEQQLPAAAAAAAAAGAAAAGAAAAAAGAATGAAAGGTAAASSRSSSSQQQAATVVDLSGEGAEAGASRVAAAGGGDAERACRNCKLAFRSERCTGPGCDGVSRFILHTSGNGSEHHARSITAHTSGNRMSRRSFLKLLGAGGATGDAFRGDWARSLAQLAEYVGGEAAAGG